MGFKHVGYMQTLERGRVAVWVHTKFDYTSDVYVGYEDLRQSVSGEPLGLRSAPAGIWCYDAVKHEVIHEATAELIGLELV